MHFTLATTALLTTLITGTLSASVDPYCTKAPCQWQHNQAANVDVCSCNTPPTPQSLFLAAFYSNPGYSGNAYKGYGQSKQCQNLPQGVNQAVESMQINTTATPSCWIYTAPDCVGTYAIVDKNNVAQMQGTYKDSVESYICDPLPPKGSS